MRLLYGLLVAAASLFAVSSAAEESNSHVVSLTKATFDDFLKANPLTLVKFMAPWCGHCKKLAPEYEAAAKELEGFTPAVKLADVDATEEKDLGKRFEVRGYPTMLFFRDGQPEPYNGGRTKVAIVDWVQKMVGPSVEWLDSVKGVEEKVESIPVAFVGRFAKKEDSAVTMFEEIASSSRQKAKFFAVVDSSVKEPTVTAYRVKEEVVSEPISTEEKLTAFVKREAMPLFGPVNGENYGLYAEQKKGWLWLAANKEDYEKMGQEIREVAKQYRDEFNAVWLNTEELGAHAEGMLGLSKYPSIAVNVKNFKYHFKGDVDATKLVQFIKDVQAGKAERFLKSEPVPEKNDEPVKVVVGKQFSEIVLQKDKDVFLKIYAPWCGHCKKLAPIWEEIAEKTAGSKNLIIAKLDGTANEPDVDNFTYHGFPTLYFVKAGSDSPIPYEGDRTADAMIKFLQENAKFPIVLSSENAEDEKDEL